MSKEKYTSIETEEAPVPTRRRSTILGRLARAVREQNWFAVFLEFAIVVLGVVIGFQVTAWGDERAAREQEQALLAGLKVEFLQVLVDLQRQVEVHERVQEALSIAIDELTEAQAAGLPAAAIADTSLSWSFVAPTTQLSQGILNGTLSAGRLELIRDQELRTALAEWAGVMADVTEDEIAARQIVINQLGPTLRERMEVLPIRSYSLFLLQSSPEALMATSEVPIDSETIGVFAERLFWQNHALREHTGPREAAERIIDLIDHSLR